MPFSQDSHRTLSNVQEIASDGEAARSTSGSRLGTPRAKLKEDQGQQGRIDGFTARSM